MDVPDARGMSNGPPQKSQGGYSLKDHQEGHAKSGSLRREAVGRSSWTGEEPFPFSKYAQHRTAPRNQNGYGGRKSPTGTRTMGSTAWWYAKRKKNGPPDQTRSESPSSTCRMYSPTRSHPSEYDGREQRKGRKRSHQKSESHRRDRPKQPTCLLDERNQHESHDEMREELSHVQRRHQKRGEIARDNQCSYKVR